MVVLQVIELSVCGAGRLSIKGFVVSAFELLGMMGKQNSIG